MINFTIGKNDANIRADRFLLKATSAPSSLIYKSFRKKDVKINGKWIKEEYILQEGDILSIYIKEDFNLKKKIPHAKLEAQIVYEDENIIIFNKPKGLLCQPDKKHPAGTLSDMLKSYLFESGKYNPENENSFSPALCNRIDTNTEGLVIGACNAFALRDMNELIKKGYVKKYYKCTLEGVLKKDSDTVDTYIIKDEEKNISRISDSDGKAIKMEYTVLERHGDFTDVEVLLHSGRSHQIRAYFSFIGHPLVGDGKYGAKTHGGQKLKSYKVVFDFGKSYNGVLSYLKNKEFCI